MLTKTVISTPSAYKNLELHHANNMRSELRRTVKYLRNALREIVELNEPHLDLDGHEIKQDPECYCSRCIAVRALSHRESKING